ncbi:MAG TPA: hypothetical protein VGF14_07005 [Alphaproteobacteria bacterium]
MHIYFNIDDPHKLSQARKICSLNNQTDDRLFYTHLTEQNNENHDYEIMIKSYNGKPLTDDEIKFGFSFAAFLKSSVTILVKPEEKWPVTFFIHQVEQATLDTTKIPNMIKRLRYPPHVPDDDDYGDDDDRLEGDWPRYLL